ncbi:MAG: hypothetical protein E7526_04995 [Ruminococcaceae bacterium]|nr:hypothetical protein [Oscillospiraceae bacterium]
MRNSAILNLNRTKFFEVFAKNRFLIFILLCYITGIIFGVLWLKGSDAVFEIAKADFDGYLSVHHELSFFNIFIKTFFSLLPICLILFLCGTSVVGIVLVPIAVCYCGFDYGICTAYLYKQYLLQGIAFNSLILIPCTLIAVLGYMMLSKEAFGFSHQLLRLTLPNYNNTNVYTGFKGYCKRFLIIILIFIGSALADTLLNFAFLNFFNF